MICYTKKRKKKHDKWKSKVDAETITKEVKEKIKEKATHKPRKKYNDTTIQLDNEHTMSITPHVLGTGLIFCKIWSTKHYLAKRDVMKYEKEIRETALRELPNSQCPVLMRELIKHGNIKICKRSALHFGEKWDIIFVGMYGITEDTYYKGIVKKEVPHVRIEDFFE